LLSAFAYFAHFARAPIGLAGAGGWLAKDVKGSKGFGEDLMFAFAREPMGLAGVGGWLAKDAKGAKGLGRI
jgi:hypothetical protein